MSTNLLKVKDNWEFMSSYPEFRNMVSTIEAEQLVFTHDDDLLQAMGSNAFDPLQKNLRVVGLDDAPLLIPQIAQQTGREELSIEDTMTLNGGTGLMLQMGNQVFPIGQSALSGLADRAGLTHDGLNRHYPEGASAVADVLNRQFMQGKSGACIIVNCDKVRAVNGPSYAVGQLSDILDMYEVFVAQFPQAQTKRCFISHDFIKWEVDLSAHADTLLANTALSKNGFVPALRFITSNTGKAAFQAIPMLKRANSNVFIPLCMPNGVLRVRHMAKGNYTERTNALMNKILQAFECVIAALDNRSRDFEKLKTINVDNAYNAVLRVMAEVGIPKKQGMEAAKAFQGMYPAPDAATAYDCMLAIINAYAFYVRDNAQNERGQMNVSFAVGAAMGISWPEYSIPGEFSW